MFNRYILGGAAAVLALSLSWGIRVDHLRSVHKDNIDRVVVALRNGGYDKTTAKLAEQSVVDLVNKRDMARDERDIARKLVEIQSASILHLHEQSEKAAREAEAQRKLIKAALRERDAWIARAKQAETRTERLSAEEELRECEQVLNSLYISGF